MNEGVAITEEMNFTSSESYGIGYAVGYSEGENYGYDLGYKKCQIDYKKKAEEEKIQKNNVKKRRLYFLKQKLMGVLILLYTICTAYVLDGDGTIALLTVPMALMLIFDKGGMNKKEYQKRKEMSRNV